MDPLGGIPIATRSTAIYLYSMVEKSSADEEHRLMDLAQSLVERAQRGGAQVAEASARAGWDLSVRVRLGEPELVEEAGHRGVSLRVVKDQRVAMTSTSDLTEDGLRRCVEDALHLAELTEPDPCAGPADPSQVAKPPFVDLDLFDPAIDTVDAAQALELAKQGEAAALAADERITLSEGASYSRMSGTRALVLSGGFASSHRGTYASLVVTPVAEDRDGKRRRGHYWTARRHLEDLEAADAVGTEAARRTLAKLGSKKVKTCEVPVIFDQDVSRSLIATFAGCIVGGAVWRKSSYLAEREGTPVASEHVTLVDDPLLPRGPGSRAFDGEGLPVVRRVVVDRGRLETFLLDCYAARKLGRSSTGSASRSGGSISASTSNFIMQAGTQSREELIRSTGSGLFVTEMMGFGFNAVTGDFSRGAAGFWIEDGELAFPVSEITISSNLDTMLKQVDAVANDLELKTSTAAPSFRIASMTIAGD